MPVVIPDGAEEKWTENITNTDELKELISMNIGWSLEDWLVEELNDSPTSQMDLFETLIT